MTPSLVPRPPPHRRPGNEARLLQTGVLIKDGVSLMT